MNDRFILIGKTDGFLAAVFNKNGVKVFSVKVTDAEILPLCVARSRQNTPTQYSMQGKVRVTC